MTIQGAIAELNNLINTEDIPVYYKGSLEKIKETIELEYPRTKTKQKPKTGHWIPVSERLPEANKAVITYIDTGATKTYCLAYWNDVREGWKEWIGFELIEKDKGYKVLAWQPLPEPYKAESEVV